MDLIKGKWYRCSNWTITIAVRYSRIKADGKFLFDQEIARGSLFRKTDWLTFRTDFIEVPLSEIQQYLPDGHPDKEFVLPEKWCVEITASNVDVLSKWRGNEDLKCGEIYGYLHSDLLWRDDIRESTEITFDQFKKYVLKTKEMEEKPIYVKVVDFGKEYQTHSDAREYGMTNYSYWTPGSPRLNPETKYKVVRNVLVNNSDESYILLDESTGYEYLIQIKGCKIIDNMEEEDIIGYKLKEDCKQYEEAALKIMNTRWGDPKYHVTVNSVIKNLIKAGVLDLWFEPIFKEKFKVGDWVMETWASSPYYNLKAFRVNSVKNNIVKYDRDGGAGVMEGHLRLANPEEIKKTLVEEAIKRGFKGGVKIDKTSLNYVGHTMSWTLSSSSSGFTYKPSRDELQWSASQDIVYRDGKWAEILPNYPQIEINGYKGEFFDWGVKFGCAEIDKDVFIRLGQIGQGLNRCNRALESVVIGKGTFSKEQIKLIADHYLNKK